MLSVVEIVLFDQIALLDADHGPEIKQAINEAQQNGTSFKMLFWAPLSIRGHTVLIQTADPRVQQFVGRVAIPSSLFAVG